MSRVKASTGRLKIGGQSVAGVRGFTTNESMTPIENSDLSEEDLVFESGDKNRTASAQLFWDPADTVGQGAVVIGAQVSLEIYPQGETSGNITETYTALVTTLSRAHEKNQMVTKSVDFQISGAPTIGAVV